MRRAALPPPARQRSPTSALPTGARAVGPRRAAGRRREKAKDTGKMTCDIVDDLLKVVSGLKRTEEMKIALKDVEIALRTVESAKQTKDEIGVCRSCIEAQCDSCANIERELDDAESQLNKVITKAITEVTTRFDSGKTTQCQWPSPYLSAVEPRCPLSRSRLSVSDYPKAMAFGSSLWIASRQTTAMSGATETHSSTRRTLRSCRGRGASWYRPLC